MMELYVDDFDRAGAHLETYPQIAEIFKQPRCHWYAPDRDENPYYLQRSVDRFMRRAAPAVPSCVLYNLPWRDFQGVYSSGGAKTDEVYLKWIDSFAAGITPHANPIIILEPDALAQVAFDAKFLGWRTQLLNKAAQRLKEAGCRLYIDVSHPRWLEPEQVTEILRKFNPTWYDGFSLNVSNFVPLEECISWSKEITNDVQKPCVIDTSRNGVDDSNTEWCNPPGRRLGHPPTFDTGYDHVDAFLWIKVPGESDGPCNGGPNAGTFWPEYALGLLGQQST